MSKSLYYRETDPNTGKAKWIKMIGVKGNNSLIFIDKRWEKIESASFIVYKSTMTRVKK